MSDLTDLQSAQTVKIAGSDSTGVESNFASVDTDGNIQANVNSLFESTDTSTGFHPDNNDIELGSSRLKSDVLGSLKIRGPTYSDEGSFRDDFSSAFLTVLTGTLTFTNGSTVVTGVGTSFLTQLNYSNYVKLSADSNNFLLRINSILSDTVIELESVYLGAGGTGSGSKCFWLIQTGTTGTTTQNGTLGTIGVGTNAAGYSSIQSREDYCPFIFTVFGRVTQRIANQSTYLGYRETRTNPAVRAEFVFSGTTNTTIDCVTASENNASNTQTTTITVPNGSNTGVDHQYVVEVQQDKVTFTIDGVIVAVNSNHIPGPYKVLNVFMGIENTGVTGSSTDLILDYAQLTNFNQTTVNTAGSSGSTAVIQNESVNYITGSLTTSATTADQVILSYTVPTGKNLYLIGWSISTNSIAATVVKIGKNTVTGDPAAPGVLNGVIYRHFYLASTSMQSQTLPASPVRIGGGGDVIKMTVTPSAITSTVWRGGLDFILR